MKKYNFYLKTILLFLALQSCSLSYADEAKRTTFTEEICDNRIDDDGDGLIDCLDPDCSGTETCWDCLTEFYQVHSNTYLVSLDPYTGAYQTLGTISGASAINGAQFNQLDGHVYAPVIVDGSHTLGMLQNNGVVIPLDLDLQSISSSIFYVGAIDAQGVFFVSNSSGIYKIDLTAETLVAEPTGINNPGVADFALDITNGLFYGISSSGKLVVFDPINLNVNIYDLAGSITTDSGAFGACWSSNDGSFFAYNNSSGKIYSVNPNDLTATLVLNGTGNLSINDGFNCVLADPPFETKCGNMIDDDGDGLIDCDDPDCFNSNVCTVEICNNGIDDDNDGWTDCSDSECFDLEICVEICDNGIDDNNNGLVDAEDPQCTTPSGVTGGLESNRRLSDKIAQRNFKTRVLENDLYEQKLEGVTPFINSADRSSIEIADFIPQHFLDAYVAESSPIELIEITNAIEIAGADYYMQDQRVATVLGIYSENGVYEHSKYICDRLDGSRLIDISYLFCYGGNFISYELINKHGQKEYAVSFAARLEDDGFYVENHWNLHKYNQESNYYNFQIWGQSYPEIIVLLEQILHEMIDKKGIQEYQTSEIPSVFVTHGEYQNGKLKLGIKNKNLTKELQFISSVRRTETAELEDIFIDIELDGSYEQLLSIETGHLYDLGASLNFPNSPSDEIFLADGSWGIDTENPDNNIQTFNVSEDERSITDTEYQIERSIELKADVKDYLNVYRSLDAKLNPKNLSAYNHLSLSAQGLGKVEITIVKASISEWENQFRTELFLTENAVDYHISLDEFTSPIYENLELTDVNMIVFSILGENGVVSNKELTLSELSFTNQVVSSTEEVNKNDQSGIFPNPILDEGTIQFYSQGGEVELSIMNALGTIELEQSYQTQKGMNDIKIDLSSLRTGQYFYHIKEGNKKDIKGRFIKVKN